ncbi:MAG: hypothetical protein LBT83_09275 [Tannerella sp.]|nr:hypothetical protein [Tannerella sp.]
MEGERLYAYVEKYTSLGDHRTGTPINTETVDWLAAELTQYGYTVHYPEFPIHQFFFEDAAVISGSDTVHIFPQWWVNEHASQDVTGQLVDIGALPDDLPLSGKIALIRLSEGQGYRKALRLIDSLVNKQVEAVVVVTENSTGDLSAFNSTSEPHPWKVPVVLAGLKDAGKLAAFIAHKKPVRLFIKGRYRDVKAKNVYGTVGTGKEHVVISTPVSGWFGCGGERGPGIAVWLELARWAAGLKSDYTFVFTGNSGHELAGIGAHLFLDKFAPAPEHTRLWIHLGAGLATNAYRKTPDGLVKQAEADSLRNFFYSDEVEDSFKEAFLQIKANKYNIKEQNGGELIYVANKGYRRILGVSYTHPYFHTPLDSATTTSPQILAAIAKAFQQFILLETEQ